MRRSFSLTFVISFLSLFLSYQGAVHAITAQDVSSVTTLTTITAKVLSIDHITRRVTLEVPGGNKVKMKVGKQAKNLAQVKVGDMVKAQYYDSIAWEILPPGAKAQPEASKTVATATAGKGEMPNAEVVETTSLSGTIEKIDTTAGVLTLKGPDGQLFPIKARYPEKLKDVKVGDQVAGTYTEALAISVEPAGK